MKIFFALPILLTVVACAPGETTHQLADVDTASLIDEWHNPSVADLAVDQLWMHEWLNEDCMRDNIYGVEVPVHHDRADSLSYIHYFEIVSDDDTKPWVFNLPGGPGGWAIGDSSVLADSFQVINVDPRGNHCNYDQGQRFDAEAMTSAQTVRDYLYILRALNISEIYIYGHSYGTVQATHLAHALQTANGSPQVMGVFLEGIVGGVFGEEQRFFDAHFEQFYRLRLEQPAIDSYFGSLEGEKRLGGSNLAWGNHVYDTGNMYVESRDDLETLASEYAEFTVTDEPGPNMERLTAQFENFSRIYSPEPPSHAMKYVGCQELFSKWEMNTPSMDEQGLLSMVPMPGAPDQGTDMCEDVPMNYPYRPELMQIEAPLYYLQGETDPQTDLAWAQLHAVGQNSSVQKEFVEIPLAGHSVLYGPLNICHKQIFRAFRNLEALTPLLSADGECLESDPPEFSREFERLIDPRIRNHRDRLPFIRR